MEEFSVIKKGKKLSWLIVGMLLVGLFHASQSVLAKDEDWSAPVFAYGWSLTDAEKAQVEKDLGISNSKDYREVEVNGSDLVKYVPNKGFDANSKAWSSALIIPLKKGSGVSVQIVTPDKITDYTEAQYRQASLDSGIFDAEIRVASPKILDGSGAFSGIRKAYDDQNPPANEQEEQDRQKNYEMSQQNMEDLAQVSQENQGEKGFSDEKLNVALAEVKQQLAEIAQKQDQLATKEDIQKMLEEALKNQKLENVITPTQINTYLIPILERYQAAPVALDSRAASAWKIYKKQLLDGTNDLADKFSKVDISEFTENAKEKSMNFFQKIVHWFKGLFGSADENQ